MTQYRFSGVVFLLHVLGGRKEGESGVERSVRWLPLPRRHLCIFPFLDAVLTRIFGATRSPFSGATRGRFLSSARFWTRRTRTFRGVTVDIFGATFESGVMVLGAIVVVLVDVDVGVSVGVVVGVSVGVVAVIAVEVEVGGVVSKAVMEWTPLLRRRTKRRERRALSQRRNGRRTKKGRGRRGRRHCGLEQTRIET